MDCTVVNMDWAPGVAALALGLMTFLISLVESAARNRRELSSKKKLEDELWELDQSTMTSLSSSAASTEKRSSQEIDGARIETLSNRPSSTRLNNQPTHAPNATGSLQNGTSESHATSRGENNVLSNDRNQLGVSRGNFSSQENTPSDRKTENVNSSANSSSNRLQENNTLQQSNSNQPSRGSNTQNNSTIQQNQRQQSSQGNGSFSNTRRSNVGKSSSGNNRSNQSNLNRSNGGSRGTMNNGGGNNRSNGGGNSNPRSRGGGR